MELGGAGPKYFHTREDIMDLKDYEQQETCEYTLRTPSGEKTDVVFTLAGPTHPVRAEFERRVTRKAVNDFNRKGKATLPDDPDELLAQQIARVSAFTLGWTNLQIDGEAAPFSKDKAREIFSDKRFAWIRDAVNAALSDVANFMPSSSAS
jgi:hypothetical protein